MQKYTDVVQDVHGSVISGASVTITTNNGGAAVIYSDNGITVLSQPIQTNGLGRFSFYAADGRYNINVTANGVSSSVLDILLEDYTTDLASSTGSSLVGHIASGTGAVARTVQAKLRDTVHVFDFMTTAQIADIKAGTALVDVTVNFQTAVTAAITYGHKLKVSSGIYNLTAPITITGGLVIEGDGVSPYKFTIGTKDAGSWLYFNHTGLGFNITNAGGVISGITLSEFGTYRNQPTPAVSWTPLACDFDVYINNADVYINDLMLLNPTKGIRLDNGGAGRLEVNRLRGQAMQVMVDIDTSYDLCKLNNIHQWAFWKDDANVHAYTMQNLDVIYSKRNDNPFIVNLFSIFARSGIRFGQNINGRTLKLKAVNLDIDRGKYGIWIDSTVTSGVIAMFTNLTTQGETGLAGSEMLRIDGAQSTIDFGVIRTDLCGLSVFDIIGANNIVRVQTATLFNYNQDVAAAPAINVAASNFVDFLKNPVISGGGAGALFSATGTIYTELWRVWTPTVTPQTGAITTVGALNCAYQMHNNRCTFKAVISITTNGTGGGALNFTLPVMPAADGVAVGREVTTSGSQLAININNGSLTSNIYTYNNAYPVASGSTVIISGSYQY